MSDFNHVKIYGNRKRGNKRIQSVLEVLQINGENPTANLIRLAIRAEKEGDLNLASRNWAEILGYIEAKRKPIDPIEQTEKLQRIATLEELLALKQAVLAGAAAVFEETQVIENAIDVTETNINEFV